MNKVTPALLNDTYNLIQLARETAKIQGQKAQAERLGPVADNLRSLAAGTQETKPAAQPSGILAQNDFKTLLNSVQSAKKTTSTTALPKTLTSSPADRTQTVVMMAAGGMSDLEIARQLGMTRNEVQMVININRGNLNGVEVIK